MRLDKRLKVAPESYPSLADSEPFLFEALSDSVNIAEGHRRGHFEECRPESAAAVSRPSWPSRFGHSKLIDHFMQSATGVASSSDAPRH